MSNSALIEKRNKKTHLESHIVLYALKGEAFKNVLSKQSIA